MRASMDEPNLAVFHTVEFIGFYLSPLVLWAAAAIVPFVVLRWAFGCVGLYRLVWHRSLFNIAVYLLVIGGLIYFGNRLWL